MALPHIKTDDKIRLVYTGDPSLNETAEGKHEWRAERPEDARKGASVAILHPLGGTAMKQCAINADGNVEVGIIEKAKAAFLGFDGDARSKEEAFEAMPHTPRFMLGVAVDRVSGYARDPFGQRSCG